VTVVPSRVLGYQPVPLDFRDEPRDPGDEVRALVVVVEGVVRVRDETPFGVVELGVGEKPPDVGKPAVLTALPEPVGDTFGIRWFDIGARPRLFPKVRLPEEKIAEIFRGGFNAARPRPGSSKMRFRPVFPWKARWRRR